jgi:hypothetical protein
MTRRTGCEAAARRPFVCALSLCILMSFAACGERAAVDDVRAADAAAIVDAESPRDLAGVVSTMMPALERLSGLDRTEAVRVRRQTRDGARAYVAARLDEELPPAERAAVRRTYVALGLLPDTLDLDALLLDLYTELDKFAHTRRARIRRAEAVDDRRELIEPHLPGQFAAAQLFREERRRARQLQRRSRPSERWRLCVVSKNP